MTEEELIQRVESSEELRRIKATLIDEVAFRADGLARLDPLTILTIISIIIQIVAYCRERNSDETIVSYIQNARTLPRRKMIRLRRRLNNLFIDRDMGLENAQPIYDAIIDMAENADNAEINEIMCLARDYSVEDCP
jgi:hypothetical protein